MSAGPSSTNRKRRHSEMNQDDANDRESENDTSDNEMESDANASNRVNTSKKVQRTEMHLSAGLRNINPGLCYQKNWLIWCILQMRDNPHLHSVATEVAQVGGFDDIVLKYKESGKYGAKFCFIQVKHDRKLTEEIKADRLVNNDKYSLVKYFRGYLKFKEKAENGEIKWFDKQDELRNCVILTICKFSKDLDKCFTKLKDKDEVFSRELRCGRKVPIRLKYTGGDASELFGKLERKVNEENIIPVDDIKEYLDKVVYAVDQPNLDQLERIIKAKIRERYVLQDEESVYGLYFRKIDEWFNERGSFFDQEDEKRFHAKIQKKFKQHQYKVIPPIKPFAARKKDLEVLHDKIQLHERSGGILGMTVITGLEGIGKTELVREYVDKHQELYDGNVIWINAESSNECEESFLELITDTRFGIPERQTENTDQIRPIKDIINDVYSFFNDEKKKCLFIFDNAKPDDDLIRFLPPNIFNPMYYKPYVLIISRNENWEKPLSPIKLSVFEETDAVKFVRDRLDVEKGGTRDEDIKNLSKELKHFPLAIKQATAYIKCKKTRGEVDIVNYLEKFKKKTEELSDSKIFKSLDNTNEINHIPNTYITYTITIENIKASKEKSAELALNILDIIAYFANESINTDIFFNLPDQDKETMQLAVELLVEYSMVNQEKENVYRVPKLVQRLTRLELQEHDKEKEILRKALELVREDVENNVDHAVSVWNHAKQDFELVKRFSSLPREIIDKLCESGKHAKANSFICEALPLLKNKLGNNHVDVIILERYHAISYGELGNYKKKKDLLEDVLRKLNEFSPQNDLEIARTLRNLGNAYGKLIPARPRWKINYFKEALDKYTKLSTEKELSVEEKRNYDIEIAKVERNLGNAYGELNKHKKKQKLLEGAVDVLRTNCGTNHFEYAKAKRNLGNVYGKLNNNEKKLQYLEEAIPILQKHYGAYHLEVVKAWRNKAVALKKLKRTDEAKQLLDWIVPTFEKILGPSHPLYIQALKNLRNCRESS